MRDDVFVTLHVSISVYITDRHISVNFTTDDTIGDLVARIDSMFCCK